MGKIELIVASQNRNKITEIKHILADLPVIVTGISEVADLPEIVEDGDSFSANAIKKAVESAKAINRMVVADDSGLVVDILNGEPGVFSARYAGLPSNDQKNNQKLLEKLAGVPWEKRTAHFHCVIALASPAGEVSTCTGICSGKIGFYPQGEHGFGYDPIFILPDYDLSFAQLNPEEKNKISHRAEALKGLRKILAKKIK